MDKILRIEDIMERMRRGDVKESFELLPPVSDDVIEQVERKLGAALPDDFRKFYSFCNGTTRNVDAFRIITLEEITRKDDDPDAPEERWKGPWEFPFADFALFYEVWVVSIDKNNRNNYIIYHPDGGDRLYYTSSLAEFLERHLNEGYVGIFEWAEEIIRNRQRPKS
ncbi:SMI1/KNR4 family protein [Chitinophaga sp. S165]|uniref:SMI1/KNR4 family protein n=1 Tax=Chitinophaga sp. S165 TaxID=2135462 RepID=UPI000D709782|nr:SMI1/KNR4 family protein [Chitinophaga sp. S165]PWV49058.1 SMI1/KNR4 family protein SUKH-1 [Chitinophaga sp. S165]